MTSGLQISPTAKWTLLSPECLSGSHSNRESLHPSLIQASTRKRPLDSSTSTWFTARPTDTSGVESPPLPTAFTSGRERGSWLWEEEGEIF